MEALGDRERRCHTVATLPAIRIPARPTGRAPDCGFGGRRSVETMKRRRRKRTGRPVGGGGAGNAASLANLIPGGPAGAAAGPGNSRSLTHGAYREIAEAEMEAKEREVFDALAADLPLREADGSVPATDALAVRLLAEALIRLASVRDFINRRGFEKADGDLQPAAALEVKLRDQALAVAKELGLTPASRVRLGIDLIRAESAAEDAEVNRRVRERLDRRLEALDGGSQ